jgi:hypothetical protein
MGHLQYVLSLDSYARGLVWIENEDVCGETEGVDIFTRAGFSDFGNGNPKCNE